MNEQPQKPEHWYGINEQYPDVGTLGEEVAVYSCEEADPYISHLESENQRLHERVAELEEKLKLHRPGAWNSPEVK